MQSFMPAPTADVVREFVHKVYTAPTQPALEEEMDADAKRMRRKGYTLIRRFPKIGRNQPCPCGSGLKFKKCHLSAVPN